MRYVRRILGKELGKAARAFPAVVLTGPRRAGKTTLLKKAFPKAEYVLLEDPDVTARVRADPRGFLDELQLPVIFDEIQNTPELLNYVRTRIDATPRRMGRWVLTGSCDIGLMRGITESMAGRAAVLGLLPFSVAESPKVTVLRGGFPEVLARPTAARLWFASYVQTYLERDVRAMSAISDLSAFRRFMSLVASRCGQILNKTDIAAPLGVSVPTVTSWLSILEATGQIILVPPFYENFGKRLIKSPKVYFVDSGLACHLLGIDSARTLNASPFLGPIFEGHVAAEILKTQRHTGRRPEVYYFRDQQGLEVDFVIGGRGGTLLLVEAKASRTVKPSDARPIERLRRAVKRYTCNGFVVHRPSAGAPAMQTVSRGVKAVDVPGIVTIV